MGIDAARIEGTTCLQLLPINILQPVLPVLHATMLHIGLLSVNHTIDVQHGRMIAVTVPYVARLYLSWIG